VAKTTVEIELASDGSWLQTLKICVAHFRYILWNYQLKNGALLAK